MRLDNLIEQTTAEDPVVLYFAGAGARVTDVNQDEPDPWDEAWAVSDGYILDDELHDVLDRLTSRAQQVALVIDASLTPNRDTLHPRYRARFGGNIVRAVDVDLPEDAWGTGDGAGRWAARRQGLVVIEAARLGAALEHRRYGVLTRALDRSLPGRASYGSLQDRLLSKVASMSVQVPNISGDENLPVFGRSTEEPEVRWTRFEVPEGTISVELATGDRPGSLSRKQVRAFQKLLRNNEAFASRVVLEEEGDWRVSGDPAQEGVLHIVGPEGAVRNMVEADDFFSVEEKVLENLWAPQ